MEYDLTTGSITKNLFLFALPLMLGNLLQQFYNIADTFIVGRFLGSHALAAVGSSYTLMIFLTSILLGLCMGSSAYFSIQFGKKNLEKLKRSFFLSFVFIGLVTLLLNLFVFINLDFIVHILQTPSELATLMKEYLFFIFMGIGATFLYNYFANLLRAIGNSVIPLIFLAISALLNIILDLTFVLFLHWGVKGAAIATVLSQYTSAIGLILYFYKNFPQLHPQRRHMQWDFPILKQIMKLSFLTCMQQSIMNLGILMIQGLVNSFGTNVMAAFAAAVKIDSFAYMPVQDFGNAFSTFIAQNYGANKTDRIRQSMKNAFCASFFFCLIISFLIFLFARPLLMIFIQASQIDILAIGVSYLRIEGSFYFGIGFLFLFYGYYRAVNHPEVSVILTVISLGTRVILSYTLSAIPTIGTIGIWASVPIGWILADIIGAAFLKKYRLA